MAFDYKKEYKEFYMPKNKPSIVEIPKHLNKSPLFIITSINYYLFKLIIE